MKLIRITIYLLTLIFVSNCAFVPGLVMSTKKKASTFKNIPKYDDEVAEGEEETYEEEDASEIEIGEAYEEGIEEGAGEAVDYEGVEEEEVAVEAEIVEEVAEYTDKKGIVNLSKMNVIYIGVDNPCRIFIPNVGSDEIKVSASAMMITKQGEGLYNLTATRPGFGSVTIAAGSYIERFDIRIKRIPTPVARLGNQGSKNIGAGEFRAQAGLAMWLDNFDFEARCKTTSFRVTCITSDGQQETAENDGAKFSEKTLTLIQKAIIGDIYLFENVKGRCPGDVASRKVNSLVFRIE